MISGVSKTGLFLCPPGLPNVAGCVEAWSRRPIRSSGRWDDYAPNQPEGRWRGLTSESAGGTVLAGIATGAALASSDLADAAGMRV